MAGTLIPTNHRLSSLLPTRDELFSPFQQYFDKVLDEFFADTGRDGVRSKGGYPRLDVLTEDGRWIIEASVPGVEAHDLKVEMLPESETGRNVLVLSGRMSQNHQYTDDATYHVRELKRSTFERRIMLPEFCKDEPEASMKNGILRLVWSVPELKQPKAKQIEVKRLDDK